MEGIMKRLLRFIIPFSGLILAIIFIKTISAVAYTGNIPATVNASWNSQAIAALSPNTPEGVIHVNTLEDELNSDGDCSLREAIEAANTNTPVDDCSSGSVLTDTIGFDVEGTIVVTSQLSVIAGGPLVIDGGNVITTTGGETTRVWWVDTDGRLTLGHLAMVNGESIKGGSLYNNKGIVAIVSASFSGNQGEQGGAIFNDGSMDINDTDFIENNASAVGGSIVNYGEMLISNSSFVSNTSVYGGGAIIHDTYSYTLIITNCTFSSNIVSSTGGGGGIRGIGPMMIAHSTFLGNNGSGGGGGIGTNDAIIIDSTFSGNVGGYGGGIYSGNNGKGNITITNSTISENSATRGGGFYNDGNTTIINSTISGNSASERGGGIDTAYFSNPSILVITNSTISGNTAPAGAGIANLGNTTLSNSIIANRPSGSDCQVNFGMITDAGHNLDSDGSCGLDPAKGSLPNTDPLLGPLQDNGGPAWTHALLTGSPAIDEGDNATCPSTDQRGVLRPIDGDWDGIAICDIGSFEYDGPPPQRFFLPLAIKSP
jgi:CSLREA domain-containing protein